MNFKQLQKLQYIFFSRPEYIILFCTTFISLIYYSLGVNSWKFSFVGDEWPFYNLAIHISEKNFFLNPLSFEGVYSQNSVLSSFYQALFIKIFGYTNFAWRLSNIILIVPITLFFFLWLQKNFNTYTALISTLLLQASFYLANFLKTGKNMPQALALFIICLYISTLFSNNPTKRNGLILGLLLGISFYIYIGPLFPLIIWPYFIPIFKKPKKQVFYAVLFLIIGYLMLFLPTIQNGISLNGPVGKTILYKEYSDNRQIFVNIYHNFLLFYKNFELIYNQFVSGPYLDFVTRLFAAIGTCIVLAGIRKKNFMLLILTYISTAVIIAITSPYNYTPTTRGIFFLPFGFVFAGIAVTRLLKTKQLAITGIILIIIFILNMYQSQIGVFKTSGYSETGLIMKTIQEAKENKVKKKVLLLLSKDNSFNYQNVYTMQQAYDLKSITFAVMRSNDFHCKSTENTDIVLFDNDIDAKNTILSLPCPRNDTQSIKTLKSNMYP